MHSTTKDGRIVWDAWVWDGKEKGNNVKEKESATLRYFPARSGMHRKQQTDRKSVV